MVPFLTVIMISMLFSNDVQAKEAFINEDNLNVRSGPGTEYKPVGQASAGEAYPIVQQQEEWVEIQLESGTGWVTTEFITINGEIEETNTEHSVKSITVQHDNTPLRDGPATSYDIAHLAKKGTEYEVISETDDWYEISNDDQTGYIFKPLLNKNEASGNHSFRNKTIVIDAGHGGHDVGAIGATGTYEKDFAYFTASELEKELTSLGANVLLTRPEDDFISLASRSSYANYEDTDAFISLHYNSFPEQPTVSGVETYYYYDQYESLATYIQQGIINATNNEDRGASQGNFYVIRQTLKPAVLIELGFISNKEKEAQLQTTVYQRNLVSGIVEGIGKYFSEQ
ncbi:N-acetylmuramoyl-L-alanine amidase [Oceanobacillus chungangensis]|uniref:N-acetylmuramoyl-L-alanine amidase n=2 Tax=Oceanobacillus chungangensis TaxID=1229152 RepID=A0A3D8Q026_9BACI|nr:N-acetylmuramoyl-L-alanine amidase [Oceanobacillus chungangensis]